MSDSDAHHPNGGFSPEPPAELRPGSLAWLETKETVLVDGWELPSVHRVPEGARIDQGEDDGCCRVTIEGVRCRATRTRRWGVCLVHAGGGGFYDPKAAAMRGVAERQRRAQARLTLGISARRAGDPRQWARVHAAERALDVATALVDAPLDDPDLSTVERQQAVVRMLSETFPLATATLSVELPADTDGVAQLGWQDMRALAARLVDDPQSD